MEYNAILFNRHKGILEMYKQNTFSKLMSEPLLHFLLIGLGLFLYFAQKNSNDITDNTQQIVMKKSTIEVLKGAFKVEKGREPTDSEVQNLLENDLREEVLFREAIAAELDKDDKIIRHHLAQKMQYLFEDVAMIDDPSEEDLRVFFPKSQLFLNQSAGTKDLMYENVKFQLKNEWIAKEQQKENDLFYQNLKNRYEIIMDEEISKILNKSVLE